MAMAQVPPEPLMSEATAKQYIGSRVSLITKSAIRYEGVLYALEFGEHSAISLWKVRAFGTEDRPSERQIPMKEEMYEFIVFRGADITKLDVLVLPNSVVLPVANVRHSLPISYQTNE